jgi:hypothetical protein
MAKTALLTEDLVSPQEYAGDTGPALCRQGLLIVKCHATPVTLTRNGQQKCSPRRPESRLRGS